MLVLENKINDELQCNNFSTSDCAQSGLVRAIKLWEEATDLILEAGRLLNQVKENTKRKFTKILSESGLEKAQVNKLIKASTVANDIPTVTARRLGVNMLTQLGQPKNQQALESIDVSDTQVSVAQKIKEYRSPNTPTPREEVRLIGKKKGQEKLRIDIPGCSEARDIYEEFKASGLSALDWLQNLCNKQPTLKEVLDEEVNSDPMLTLSQPWNYFPQKWEHDGKECSYDVVGGQRIIRWGDYQTIVSGDLAAKYINPRTFLDFELIAPGALVKIETLCSIEDKTWNSLPAYVQDIKSNKARVALQGDYREKSFPITDLHIIEPSPVCWALINTTCRKHI